VVAPLLVFVVYPLSLGPIMYAAGKDLYPAWMQGAIDLYFQPMFWFVFNAAPQWFVVWFIAYQDWWLSL
jgi:hypothetical protein